MQRREIIVRGVVQGVGFRPYVYSLARRHRLSGFVKNRVGAVHIEVEGEDASLDRFVDELCREPPSLAYVASLSCRIRSCQGDNKFEIQSSEADLTFPALISPDVATCDDCRRELFDPNNRRYRYPFINCTNCGPRLTIITGAPYDRERTTMASFAMCPECLTEYRDTADRRFHAQATACWRCGPRLELRDGQNRLVECHDLWAYFAVAIRAGKIGAIKGLGGYHLTCDATNEAAVAELRRRKGRDEKPFAVMAPSLEAVESLCEVNAEERALLSSPAHPIVLLRKKQIVEGTKTFADSVAPGNPYLGVMLPYTPLHHLLSEATAIPALVMTSGNQTDEPIVYRDDDAAERLRGIVDLFLTHDREIHVRCDDSVTRVVVGYESPIRRSRGYAPLPVALPFSCSRPILAVGGQLKGAFALGVQDQAILSHHLGDLDHWEAFQAFERDIAEYQQLFGIAPQLIAHDLHPDYASTRYAEASSLRRVAVQHHHAHLASCMAENGLSEPVIGVIWDGAGLGADGAIWGGEFLMGDFRSFHRAAHLRYVGMPGGEKAAREPWRMATAHLLDAGCSADLLAAHVSHSSLRIVETMLHRQIQSPLTSSIGRLFDAVAAMMGLRHTASYEGQAAAELEWLAEQAPDAGMYPIEIAQDVIDSRPLIRALAVDVSQGVARAVISRRFHSTLIEMMARVCKQIRSANGLCQVVLSGGAFMNAILAREATERLGQDDFEVFRHVRVPCNDGGLCLGQLAVAAYLSGSLNES